MMGVSVEAELNNLFLSNTSPISYSSATELYKAARSKGISKSDVDEYLKGRPSYYTHAPARRNYPRRKMKGFQLNSHHQADLADMSRIAEFNDGFKWFLLVVDTYSRQISVRALKIKKPSSVAEALREHFQNNAPYYLCHDKGKEFWGKEVVALCKEYGIEQYSIESDAKAAQTGRFIKTLKQRIYRYFTQNNTWRWVDIIEQFADNINNTYCSAIDRKPSSVTYETRLPEDKRVFAKHSKFKKGDCVVLSNLRRVFDKAYLGTFGKELFVVSRVNLEKPVTYRIVDQQGEKIEGIFYDQELRAAKNVDNVYKVEKILAERKRCRKKEYLVKWLDYPESFNSWVAADDVIKL